MSWQSPHIATDPYSRDQLPDPITQAETLAAIRVNPIPIEPLYERNVGGIVEPDVPRDAGWHAPQIDNQISYLYQPLQAPDVARSNLAFTKLVQQAAKPAPTYSATGLTVPLRAPGINEGMSS